MSSDNGEMELTELQSEALREILNMGSGQAAASLAALTGEHFLLSVPSVVLATVSELERLQEDEGEGSHAVMLHVDGDLTGFTSMIFSLSAAKKLLRVSLGEDSSDLESEVLVESALMELGNIVVGTVVSAFSNTLGLHLVYSTPTLVDGKVSELVAAGAIGVNPKVIAARISFSIVDGTAEGYLATVFDLESMHNFLPAIDKYLADNGLA